MCAWPKRERRPNAGTRLLVHLEAEKLFSVGRLVVQPCPLKKLFSVGRLVVQPCPFYDIRMTEPALGRACGTVVVEGWTVIIGGGGGGGGVGPA